MMKPFDREKLTPNFARWEFTVSDTATRRDISNIPDAEQWLNLKALSLTCLEPARAAMGPIRITSGYRCPALNTAIGGATTSQHMVGEAADIIPMTKSLAALFVWLHANVPFDQLIWEFGDWVHVSHKREGENRRQALLAYRKDGKTVYAPITDEQINAL